MESDNHVFALLEQVRLRALRLLQRQGAPAAHEPAPWRDAAGLAGAVSTQMARLAATFALPPLGVTGLVCLLAAEYDPIIRHLQRTLQVASGRAWLELGTLAELIDLPLREMPALLRIFAEDGPLRSAALVEGYDGEQLPGCLRRVKLDDRVADYLVGAATLPRGSELRTARVRIDETMVPELTAAHIANRVRRAELTGRPLLVEVTGAAGGGKRHFVEAIAHDLGRPLLVVNLAAVDQAAVEHAGRAGLRDARLHGALVCFANCDAQLVPSSATAPAQPPAALARVVASAAGAVFLTAVEPARLLGRASAALARVSVPSPSPAQRATLLAAAIERAGCAPPDAATLTSVARRFALSPGCIEAAARHAADLANAATHGTPEVSPAALREACGAQLSHDLQSVATRITPEHRWDDLVVGPEVRRTLREMVAYVRHAGRVYDDWQFGPRHRAPPGVSALFSGPPGTGKTMCANVIARELDMELFRVDLSTVVSKWVGETEKNLGRIFDEAQQSNAIILFDEADALFAKRTDVGSSNDRYANLQVNFLLQRLESFSGISILTSNHEDAIDPAFKRRLAFRVRFEKPSVEERTLLWRKMIPAAATLADDVDLSQLARAYDLSGGNIRNAALRAAFLATDEGHAIDMATCRRAAERECVEMGQLVIAFEEEEEEESDAAEDEAFAADEFVAVPVVEYPPRPAVEGQRSRIIPVTHPRVGGAR